LKNSHQQWAYAGASAKLMDKYNSILVHKFFILTIDVNRVTRQLIIIALGAMNYVLFSGADTQHKLIVYFSIIS
jgi:hypothetical protein